MFDRLACIRQVGVMSDNCGGVKKKPGRWGERPGGVYCLRGAWGKLCKLLVATNFARYGLVGRVACPLARPRWKLPGLVHVLRG